MAKGRDEEIKDIMTPWEGYAGTRIEEFIKRQLRSRAGYMTRSQEKGADNNYHLYGFATEEDYNEWNTDPDAGAHLLLFDVPLPDSGGGGSSAVSYVVGLYRDGSGDIITTDNTVKLRIRFTSQEFNPITQSTQDTTESGTLTLQTRLSATAAWTTRGTIPVPSLPADSGQWTELDITDLISAGAQQVRIIVKGDVTGLNTRYLQFNVTKTTLALDFATQWEKPVTDGVMRLQFYIQGAVSKTLNLRIDGKRELSVNIGTAVYTETPRQVDIADSEREPEKVITHGIHEIEAWLSVNDSAVESEHLFCQLMVVTDSADPTPHLILNDVNTRLTNWTAEHILSYALYNPSGEAMPLRFMLTDYSGRENYMTLDMGSVTPGIRHSLDNTIEIESELTSIDAYMRFLSGDRELRTMMGFFVDNTENFAPVPGADFILNPKVRTNTEANPLSIVNHADGSQVPSRWSGFGLQADGWIQDDEGFKCLRIPAGRSLEIDYEPYTGFIGTDNRSSLTIEMELATHNATGIDDALLRMCSYLGSDLSRPLGFELRPTQAAFLTEQKREYGDQDILFQEGVRTHIALNIIYGINGSSQNYVRIFVNGIINREFAWEPSDTFVQYVGSTRTSQGIRIGSGTCDIDVYGIRVYKKSLSASDIRQDYMASLPSSQEKLAFRAANDILDDANHISYVRARERYNVMLVTGPVPSYSTGNVKTTTDVEIHTLGDPTHSGKMNGMETSGQGTSSRSYWLWNLQWKFKDSSRFVNELGEDMGAQFALDDTVPAATKLVAKLNWASSQQSHKMGSCNLFTDLWRRCVGGSSITHTPGFENCRPAVRQKPYLLFVRESESDDPVFYGLYTFGPGKGDKPTFGYDKKAFPSYLMIEGCDNGEPLTNHRIPWNEDISIGGDEDELVMFNGAKQWEIDMGNSDSLSYFKDAFNFIYQHTPHIEPFVGSLAQLQADETLNRQHLYWVTVASGAESARFDLYRFDVLTDSWVNAGVRKSGPGQYERLNLSTQLGISPSGNIWSEINNQFIAARVARFREGASRYINLKDAFFCQMFLKFIGASDNRAKNTYMYLATVDGVLKIHFAQDDLDTIFTTDNVGRKNKPYYVEEHDRDAIGGTYWNGEENALYDLMELAFPDELRAMMNSILSEMAALSSDHTPFGCMDDYYFSTQRYFPAVAYNEAARLLYETAAQKWDTGQYVASTHPLTQSLGDQLQGEMQWVRQRIVYMSSFASYGAFTMNGEGALTWRSATETAGKAPEYTFQLTPHMWLYPSVSAGSSTVFGKGNSRPVRVKAGETFTLDGVQADNDTNIQLHGIHYYSRIGNFGDKSLTGSFTVAGDRLTEFVARSLPMEFRPSNIIVTAPLIETFDINGASTVAGTIAFGSQTRLETVDLRGTSITSFSIAEPSVVRRLYLPATLTSLTLSGYAALTQDNFIIEGASRIQSLRFSDCPGLSSQQIVAEMCSAPDNDLHECHVDGVRWTGFALAHLLRLADVKADLRGTIALASAPTFEEKIRLLEAFGNIDDSGNSLYVDYSKVYLTSVELTGDSYYSEPGKYRLTIIPSSTRANAFTKMEWKISSNSYATIDSATGEITVSKIGTPEARPSATVTLTVTTSGGSSVSSTMQIFFYAHECQLGDFVFSDGSYSDILDKRKTVVGVCFYIDLEDKTRRLCVALEDLTYFPWGLSRTNWPDGIILSDSSGYTPFDIPSITNKTIDLTILDESSYRDETSAGDSAGFKIHPAGSVFAELGWVQIDKPLGGYREGTYLPWGLVNTLKIVEHRDKILLDANVDLPLPQKTNSQSEMNHLMQLIQKVVEDNSGATKYREFYYPAASQCHAYQPGIRESETLNDCFKAGKWFLPSAGEVGRLFWYHSHNREQERVKNGIFAAHLLYGFKAFTGGLYWTSNELTEEGAWGVNFATGGTGNVYKYNSVDIRPIAAF